MEQEFWLSTDGNRTWVQVDKATWVAAERAAGYRNTMGQPNEPATASFGNGSTGGRTWRPGPGEGLLIGFDDVVVSPSLTLKVSSNGKGRGHHELWDGDEMIFCGMGAVGVQSQYALTRAIHCQRLHGIEIEGFTY